MTRFLAMARAGLRTLILLAVLPAVMYTVGGSPLPRRVPTPAQAQAWLNAPFDPRYAAATARTAAWLLWAIIATTVMAVAVARGRQPRIRLIAVVPTPMQGLAATLIGAAGVTAAASTLPAHASPPVAAADDAGPAETSTSPAPAGVTRPVNQPPGAHLRANPGPVRPPVVTVQRGDTLSAIAEQHLGDADRWPAIFTLNRDKHFTDVGGTLTDPDVIYPGWKLVLPTSPAADTPPRRPALPPPDDTMTPAPDRTPEPASAPAPSPSPSQSGHASQQADDRLETQTPGISLPGGWVTVALAGALTAAAALAWRTRTNHSAPPANGSAPEAATALTVMNRQLRRHDGHAAMPAAAQPTVSEYQHNPAATAPLPAPIAPIGPHIAGHSDLQQPGGRVLAGPGAEAAARAVLLAALTSGQKDDPDAQEQAIVTADTLTALFGDDTAQLAGARQLTVAADLPDALTQLDELLIERRRLLQEYNVTDFTALRTADPAHPPMPPILLLTHTPPAHLHARLHNTLLLGADLQLSSVLLGDWPHGTTLTVGADGHTGTGRVAVLDVATAVQLLATLADPTLTTPDAPTLTVRPDPELQDGRRADVPAPEATRPHPGQTPTEAATPGRVRIALLGTPAIHGRDGENTATGLRLHARELLVYLAVHRTGSNLPDIMEAMWPDATLRRAAQRLSTEVADLRRRIRTAAGNPNIQPVVNTGGRYHLDPAVLDIDLWQLLDTMHTAQTAEPAARKELVTQAVGVGAGPLAAGYDYDWLDPYRLHIRRLAVTARLTLAELTPDPPAAAALLRDAAALEPANEDLARRAIRALHAIGDQTGASQVLHQLQSGLADIDEEPSPDTRQLAASLS